MIKYIHTFWYIHRGIESEIVNWQSAHHEEGLGKPKSARYHSMQ